jgi:hypothetical protein
MSLLGPGNSGAGGSNILSQGPLGEKGLSYCPFAGPIVLHCLSASFFSFHSQMLTSGRQGDGTWEPGEQV